MRLKAIFYMIISFYILTSPAFSAVYHIDPSVSTNGNGTAQSPFRHWSQLPGMNTGDDVYFKCGTTFSPSTSVNINWGGTSSNPAVIGAYYLDGGNPVYGVLGERPTISGNDYRVPSRGTYGGLIFVGSKDYVHIKNLILYRSGGHALKISGDKNTGTNAAYFMVQNIKVEGAYRSAISVESNPQNYGLIEGCEANGAGYGWYVDDPAFHTWPATISIAHCSNSNLTVRGNYVHENWGEGIAVWRDQSAYANNSGYVTIEDNVIWNNRRGDIYIDSTNNNIVRRNFCIGAKDSTFSAAYSDSRPWNQLGIWVNSETYNGVDNSANNNRVFNNFITGLYRGMGIASEAESGAITGNVFYNNTVIGNRYNITIGHRLGEISMSGNEFKNNVSYCPPDTVCEDIDRDLSWLKGKITADYNAWSKKPKYLTGPNDTLTNDEWSKVYGWQKLSSIPELVDFMPKKGNPVIGAGLSLPSPFDRAISLYKSGYHVSPLKILIETIDRKINESRWDIGALPFQVEKTLNAPVLTIKVSSN